MSDFANKKLFSFEKYLNSLKELLLIKTSVYPKKQLSLIDETSTFITYLYVLTSPLLNVTNIPVLTLVSGKEPINLSTIVLFT